MTNKQLINEEIKKIYLTNNKDLEATLKQCLEKKLVESKKQLIGKLCYLKVYQKAEKQVEVKEKKISKKDIIAELEQITGLNLFDLIEAKKEGLLLLLDWVKNKMEV